MNIITENEIDSQIQGGTPAHLFQLKKYLDGARISYSVLAHEQNLSSAQDGMQAGLGTLSMMAPTFVLQTEAGFLAAIIRGDTRLSYKKIKQKLGLKNVALAPSEQVKLLTGSEVGKVALVNHGLNTIVDERVMEMATIYGGCGEANYTLIIRPQDVITLTQAQVFDFTELKENTLP